MGAAVALAALSGAAVVPAVATVPDASPAPAVDVLGLGVTGLLGELEAGRLTSEQAVAQYLDRIRAYDWALGAIVSVNPDAMEQARALDEERAAGVSRGPLHGVPVLVKDNIDTAELPTSHGNQALAGYQPLEDSTVVRRLREAGAIVLAKTNMAEFAMYWDTYSSVRGRTRNPYDLARNINGSSGGSGAGVAAGLGAAGFGTESCGSVTDVASFANLVGLRPTVGLVSAAGMDANPLGDSVGPLALSVEDASLLLDVLAGTDPDDPRTAEADAHRAASYTTGLSETALEGARIGYLVHPFGGYDVTLGDRSDSVLGVVDGAVGELEAQGATVVPITLPGEWLATYTPADASYWAATGQEAYFARTEATGPVGLAALTAPTEAINYADLVAASERMDATTEAALLSRDGAAIDPAEFDAAMAGRALFAEGVQALYDEHGLDALAYPTVAEPPVALHDDPVPTLVDPEQLGTHCGWANFTGRPVVTVPAGFDADGLPVGVSLLGEHWGEAELLALAYDYEQAEDNRESPETTPSLLPE